jgi:hypothetical protein
MGTPGQGHGDQFAISGGNFIGSAFGSNSIGTQHNNADPAAETFRQQMLAALQEIKDLLTQNDVRLADPDAARQEVVLLEQALAEQPPNRGKAQASLRALTQYATPVAALLTAVTGATELVAAHWPF